MCYAFCKSWWSWIIKYIVLVLKSGDHFLAIFSKYWTNTPNALLTFEQSEAPHTYIIFGGEVTCT